MSLIARLCTAVASFFHKRTFVSDTSGKAYLTRYRIGRIGEATVNLHHFHRSDEDQELHSHPWKWACSLVLVGGYVEERRDNETDIIWHKHFKPGYINIIKHDIYHRVDLIDEKAGAWTLFVTGPKWTSWAFWNRDTGLELPWRDFIKLKRMLANSVGGLS